MAINIRSEKTLAALKEISEITGQPMTTELEFAVLNRLEDLKDEKQRLIDERIRKLKEIVEKSSINWPEDKTTRELMDELYDENGLPI